MSTRGVGSDWKSAILRDFSKWLAEMPSAAEPAREPAKRPALADLHAEVAALRQEIVLQNRTQQRSVTGLETARSSFAALGEQLQGQAAALAGTLAKQGGSLDALSVIMRFLEIRDSLGRTRSMAEQLLESDSGPGLPASDANGLVRTLDLILRKFDRLLEEHGVTRVETAGREFDPSTMNAVGAREETGMPHGSVVEEVRGGFFFGERLLRAAEVFVSSGDRPEGERNG